VLARRNKYRNAVNNSKRKYRQECDMDVAVAVTIQYIKISRK
jgi:hypothetical protein